MKLKFAVLVEIEIENTEDYYDEDNEIAGYKPTLQHVTEFVRSAVQSWGGQLHPVDPFFPTHLKVKVR